MFKTILIANRGEIACRVMRTAKEMGIRTVAVYSEADAKAPHVKMADEAVLIGPAPSAESYLKAEKILEVARQTGAEAIHPGYGFLSENAGFAEACAKAGIVFIGPSPDAIRAMGLKDRAKALMEEAGVPVTPGYHGEDQDPQHLKAEADKIGYPVLIKAVAGGGGKGMRKVDDGKDFLASLESCQREASKSFGDDNVLIEKFITSPRHIEVQVFGDNHGNVIHLYERDCSLQRRHQKVIEEAPAPGMTDEVRAAMTKAAVDAAKAVNYSGAGTVEFIVDGSGALRPDGFFFMEMNTRLQVEHPVTEMVTGLDLVKLQLEVAAGGKVPSQDDITLTGHSIEARLYAEDPQSGFLPSTGPLKRLRLPYNGQGIRVDTGVEEGGEVSLFYDPMIAKVISFASGRQKAIARLADAIEDGVATWPVRANGAFLRRALLHPDFMAGDVSTHFIERYLDELVPQGARPEAAAVAALAALRGQAGDPWGSASGWRMNATPRRRVGFEIDESEVELSIQNNGDTTCVTTPWGEVVLSGARTSRTGDISKVSWQAGNETRGAEVAHLGEGLLVLFGGEGRLFAWPRPDALADALAAGNAVKAPMPGKVLAVHVKPGQSVTKGDPMVVLEAMKMEHALTAPRDGVVESVSAEAGSQVGEGDALITLADEAEAAA
ncbi:MAG: methylcrotonoyl-CoA carboxylase [Maricaulis sp.]|nr:methylcrotonoyl-CoA carboxylase [Maricaulis sp.]